MTEQTDKHDHKHNPPGEANCEMYLQLVWKNYYCIFHILPQQLIMIIWLSVLIDVLIVINV